jgi:glutathione peroxidase
MATSMHRGFLGLVALGVLAITSMGAAMAEDKVPAALAFKMESLQGKPVELKQYAGKVVLVVNVASECGLTPQYEQLQSLYEKYNEKGLVVLGFPCNQFGGQEPGSSKEISEFCTKNYGVKFDMFQKVDVNGEKACDLYKYLTSLDTKPTGKGKISWNFEKFLIGRDGQVLARFSPRTKPDDPEVVAAVEKALAAK